MEIDNKLNLSCMGKLSLNILIYWLFRLSVWQHSFLYATRGNGNFLSQNNILIYINVSFNLPNPQTNNQKTYTRNKAKQSKSQNYNIYY